MSRSVVAVEGTKSREYAFQDGESLTIGRATENTIAFSGQDVVSRRHARLILERQQLQLESHGRNGTLVNGAFIRNAKTHTLKQGDVIQFGPGGPRLKVLEAPTSHAQSTSSGPWLRWSAATATTVLVALITTLVVWHQRETRIQERVEAAEEQIEEQTERAHELGNRLSSLERASEKLSQRFDQEMERITAGYGSQAHGGSQSPGFPSEVLESVYLVGAASSSGSITTIGTCFSVNRSGTLVTNHHVIEGAANVYVKRNSEYYPARIVTRDSRLDVAVLRVGFPTTPLQTRELGRDEVGIEAFAVGFPWTNYTRGHATVTRGVVSGITGNGNRLITDADINPGNSGGPLVDSSGRVIGMNTSALGDTVEDGAAFAVTVDAILKTF